MAEVREGLRYLSSHEWVRLEDDGTVTVGISDHAQHALGDVVFVELPEVGQSVNPGDDVAVVESVKAASDIYAPLAGKVIAYNDQLEATPETVNESPFDDGWFLNWRSRIRADSTRCSQRRITRVCVPVKRQIENPARRRRLVTSESRC